MKKRIYVVAAIAVLGLGGQAEAFMDKLKSAAPVPAVAPAAGGALEAQDFEGVFQLFTEADNLLASSVSKLVQMVCNKDVSEGLSRKMAEAQATKDPKEREAAIKKVTEEQTAALLEATERAETKDQISKLSSEQKKLAADATHNFILAGLKDKVVVDMTNQIVSKVKTNPSAAMTYANEISRTKDIASTLPSQVTKIVQIGDNLVKLAKSGNIEITIPKTHTDKPKEVPI